MEEALKKAGGEGNTDALYAMIKRDPHVLDRIDAAPFADTPLHTAVAAGQAVFAMEIMALKPSFARKLNPEGVTPLHLALLYNHTYLAQRIIHCDETLIRVKGRGGATPLHHVVAAENMHLLAVFLFACPESVEDLTVRMESVLHIAVKHQRVKVFEFLLRWLHRVDKEELLNWSDEDRSTVLHIATSTNQPEIVELLLGKKIIDRINKNAVNSSAMTALDIAERPAQSENRKIIDMLRRSGVRTASKVKTICIADYMSENMSLPERLEKCLGLSRHKLSPSDLYNMVLVVAVLIATATFQAGLSPPGGFWQDNSRPAAPNNSTLLPSDSDKPHDAGKVIIDVIPFAFFSYLNSAAFYASIGMIRVLTMGLGYDLLQISIFFLCFTYFYSVVYTTPSVQGQLEWIAFGVMLILNIASICALSRISAVMELGSYVFQQRQVNAFHRRLA